MYHLIEQISIVQKSKDNSTWMEAHCPECNQAITANVAGSELEAKTALKARLLSHLLESHDSLAGQ